MTKIKGGRTLYGHAVGILMLDTIFPRPIGDCGNALTWPFPVRFKVVPDTADNSMPVTPAALEAFVAGARELEAEGARVITTSCGYISSAQRDIAAAVSVPVITSSLLQVPMVSRMIRPDQRVGILTERPLFQEEHFTGVGWSPTDTPVAIMALPEDAYLPEVYFDQIHPESDLDRLEQEMVEASLRMKREHPDVGALVLECTNFVPFSQAMRRASGLPVFDLYTLVIQTYEATTGTTFPRG